MRINIEASAEELAEIIANGVNISDLPCEIIAALDDNFSLPGYNVTVNEPSAIQAQLVDALRNLIIASDNLDPQCGIPIGYGQLIDATMFADTALAAAEGKP